MIHPEHLLQRRGRGLLLALLFAPAGAWAQSAQGDPAASIPNAAPAKPAAPDESMVVQQLLVVGRRPGPALWRVTRGDSQVVIVGGVSPVPHLLQWNPVRVQKALAGANTLFLASDKPHANLFDVAAMVFRQGALRPAHGADMETTLPPDLRARVDRTSVALHLNPNHYRRWKPAVAGLIMIADFRRNAGLASDKPDSTVAKLAQAAHVKVRMVGDLRIKPIFDAAARMTDAQNQICLRAALDDLDYEAAHVRPAAQAWAVGDLQGVRANTAPSLFDGCLRQVPSLEALIDKGERDAVKTIDDALARPGRTVAVIDLTYLLGHNGVLDRLQAEGDQIAVPGE